MMRHSNDPINHQRRFTSTLHRIRTWFASLRKLEDGVAKKFERLFGKGYASNRRSVFRRLEPRRMFAVDAFFSGGALEIQITSGGNQIANLIGNGSTFFVDENNNLSLDGLEIGGNISDLQSVYAHGPGTTGSLFWGGDFTNAPLASPLGSGKVIQIETIHDVTLSAAWKANGDVSVSTAGNVLWDGKDSIQGNLQVTTSSFGSVTDTSNAKVNVAGDATIFANGAVALSDSAGNAWSVGGTVHIESPSSVDLGGNGVWDAAHYQIKANNGSIRDINQIVLDRIDTVGDFYAEAKADLIDSPSAKIQVGGVGIFIGKSITLADSKSDALSVTGKTTFIANGGDVMVDSIGNVSLGDIVASGKNITIYEDASMSLTKVVASEHFLAVTSDSMTDTVSSFIQSKSMTLDAQHSIQLGDNGKDLIFASAPSSLTSHDGDIDLGLNGTTILSDVSLHASKGDIRVGGPGGTFLGLVDAKAMNISIQEDADLTVETAFADDRLVLISSGSITNTQVYDSLADAGIRAHSGLTHSATYTHLSGTSIDHLQSTVGANGVLGTNPIFQLNTTADVTGQSYLDALGINLPVGVTYADPLLSSEMVAALRSQASYIQSFGNDYALFVRNQGALTIDGVQALGDGTHVLIETEQGSDLTIAGQIVQRFTGRDPGGVVLIAGGQLNIGARGEVLLESITLDPATIRRVTNSDLTANAFDGAQGPAGFESTRDVLYASDAFADTGIQNVLQRVSTQFGDPGEAGFQVLIQYADGNLQRFDQQSEVLASTLTGAGHGNGTIQAHSIANGDAAVVERATPYSDSFLGTYQTLPTTAIFRRSGEIFLFENGGKRDSSVTRVDLTPQLDFVHDVFSPGRKISFPMPTEIVVSKPLLIAPQRGLPVMDSAYAMQSTTLETKPVSNASFEVIILRVGFDDINQDGQPDASELPTRSEIQIVPIIPDNNGDDAEQDAIANASLKPLSPGQLDLNSMEYKGVQSASAEDVERWVEEYRSDPTKRAGAYAILSVDSIVGTKVLRVFAIRDFSPPNPMAVEDDQQSSSAPRSVKP